MVFGLEAAIGMQLPAEWLQQGVFVVLITEAGQRMLDLLHILEIVK